MGKQLVATRFTHVDPFEDTERRILDLASQIAQIVSPTSIRSRILKASGDNGRGRAGSCFTHVDPFEDTESGRQSACGTISNSFTHVDPFKDTESFRACGVDVEAISRFTHVDPFEDTESKVEHHGALVRVCLVSPTSIRSRILKERDCRTLCPPQGSFTHVDPFEDTERQVGTGSIGISLDVSPTSIRSRILKVCCTLYHSAREQPFHPRRSVRGY